MELSKDLLRQAEGKGMEEPDEEMSRNAFFSMSRPERKAFDQIHAAWLGFSKIRKEADCLDLPDFYEQHVGALWQDQRIVQEARKPEFESLDPRWERYEQRGEDAFVPWWLKESYGSEEERDS